MRLNAALTVLSSLLLLTNCASNGSNPQDPYESVNRKTHAFNTLLDKVILKPVAKTYTTIIPSPIRSGVTNFFNNIYLIPTVANDLLQNDWHHASDDAGRFVVNSTFGLAGLVDVASRSNLPLHHNDLGLTFAKWGDKKSPYIVIPFFGPSTIRDGMGTLLEYPLLTPYPYVNNGAVLTSLFAMQYIDIRAQYLDTDHLIDEALDKYSFIRDAYLQRRHFQIYGESLVAGENATDSLYVDDEKAVDYVDDSVSLKKQ